MCEHQKYRYGSEENVKFFIQIFQYFVLKNITGSVESFKLEIQFQHI